MKPSYNAISDFGTGFAILSHSPLKALISQSLNSSTVRNIHALTANILTFINNSVSVVEVDAVIRIREYMDVIIIESS